MTRPFEIEDDGLQTVHPPLTAAPMLSEKDVFARLTALHAALVEKLGAQPYLGAPTLMMCDERCSIAIWDTEENNGPGRSSCLHRAKGDTIAATLADAEAFVASMPGPLAQAKHDWHRDLAKVIDRGHGLALPDDVMLPLRASSAAMHKNLLAAPATATTEGAA